MVEAIFVLCQAMSDGKPVMREGEFIRKEIVCDVMHKCTESIRVLFIDTKEAEVIPENSCLYKPGGIKDEKVYDQNSDGLRFGSSV